VRNNKGRQNGTKKARDSKAGDDAAKEKTANAKKSAADVNPYAYEQK